jgi:hypothetical protein
LSPQPDNSRNPKKKVMLNIAEIFFVFIFSPDSILTLKP